MPFFDNEHFMSQDQIAVINDLIKILSWMHTKITFYSNIITIII